MIWIARTHRDNGKGFIVRADESRLLDSSSKWPHVRKLCLRLLQPLAQAFDVFIVPFVLLLVHFQQRPQDFDAMLFLHHALTMFKLAYNSSVSGFRRGSSFVVICRFNCYWFLLFAYLFVSDCV